MEREELGNWLRLALTPGVGNQGARSLLQAFGLPDAVFRQSAHALRQIVTQAQVSALRSEPDELAALLELTWNWLQQSGAGSERRQIVALGDANYPQALLGIDDPPLMLYLQGATDLGTQALLAVVGSRNPTPQGAANARNFSRTLAQAGLPIVSGLALGIDGAAHEGALDSVRGASGGLVTLAVVGTGLDRVYPKSHHGLAHRIAQHGLLISEYPLGTPPLIANFPKRNRLIAGLAQGTLVVEAALRSGSLITARLTVDQGKDVFAIPGSIHSPQSRGCHALIKQGAKLVESAQDVLEEMKIGLQPQAHGGAEPTSSAAGNPPALLASEQRLLDALGFDPVALDALQLRSNIDTAALQAQLMELELAGHVMRLPGGRFQRTQPV